MASDEAIEKRMQELRDLSARFGKAKATESYLTEFRGSKLSILMKEAEVAGHKTAAAQEREARANPQYISLLESLRDATEAAETLRWQLRIAEMGVDIWRTNESSKRAEKRGYGA